MDWKFTLVMLFGIFVAAFGWQLALYFPPDQYQFAGWMVAGVCAICTGIAAAATTVLTGSLQAAGALVLIWALSAIWAITQAEWNEVRSLFRLVSRD